MGRPNPLNLDAGDALLSLSLQEQARVARVLHTVRQRAIAEADKARCRCRCRMAARWRVLSASARHTAPALRHNRLRGELFERPAQQEGVLFPARKSDH